MIIATSSQWRDSHELVHQGYRGNIRVLDTPVNASRALQNITVIFFPIGAYWSSCTHDADTAAVLVEDNFSLDTWSRMLSLATPWVVAYITQGAEVATQQADATENLRDTFARFGYSMCLAFGFRDEQETRKMCFIMSRGPAADTEYKPAVIKPVTNLKGRITHCEVAWAGFGQDTSIEPAEMYAEWLGYAGSSGLGESMTE